VDQVVDGNDFHLDHQDKTGNSTLNFNQGNSVQDPSNQDNTHAANESSGSGVAGHFVLIKLVQQGSSSVTSVGEKDQISMAKAGNSIQEPCDLVFVMVNDTLSLNNSPSHAGHKTKQQQQERLMLLPFGSTVHGTVPCDMSPVAGNLQSKDKDGNSSMNFNHGLHSEETTPCIDDLMTLSHIDKNDQEAGG
jgi:hypothetical protein